MRPHSAAAASPHRRHAAAVLLASLMAAASPAQALQVLDAKDGVAIEAIVSLKEPTRIRIEGTPIVDVFGNVYSSSCGAAVSPGLGLASPGSPATQPVNPGGEFVLECDRDKGEIYIRPVGESGKPINVFISSAHATYTLLLRRSDVPADTIVIRDRTAWSVQAGHGPQGPSANHVRSLKALLVAMASDRVPADVLVEEVGQPVQLWTGSRLTLLRRYEGRGLVGEKYELRNTGSTAMVLAEPEFDREDGRVAGVAIENHNLRPGESTSVFVIRRGSAR